MQFFSIKTHLKIVEQNKDFFFQSTLNPKINSIFFKNPKYFYMNGFFVVKIFFQPSSKLEDLKMA